VSSLQGSACMNNTYCLFIFLVLILLDNRLTWNFHAEALVTVIVVCVIALYSRKTTSVALESFFLISM